jgi:hypothetical protein
VAHRALYRDVPFLASLFFNAVRRLRAEFRVRLVRRYVPASAGRCILRGPRLLERARWAWDPLCRHRVRRGRAAVRAGQREGLGSAMFRAA